jgi:hypothetical protein
VEAVSGGASTGAGGGVDAGNDASRRAKLSAGGRSAADIRNDCRMRAATPTVAHDARAVPARALALRRTARIASRVNPRA